MNENYFEQLNPHLVASLQDTADERVLEIGCASGQLGAAIKALHPVHWTGVEIAQPAFEKAREVLDLAICADIETDSLELKPGSYDRLVLGDVLEHLRDPWKALTQLSTYLKPKGRVICSLPNINHWTILVELMRGHFTYQDQGILDRTHLRFFTIKEALQMLEQSGLRIDRVESIEVESEDMTRVVNQFNSLRGVLGIQNPNFEREAQTYQWLIHAHKPPA